MSDREGNDRGEVAALRDRLAEKEREAAHLRALLESSPSGIAVLEGPDLRCTFSNPALERLTQVTVSSRGLSNSQPKRSPVAPPRGTGGS